VVEKLGGKRGMPTIAYEAAVKYNYTKEELSVVVDVVSMTKALADQLARAEPDFAPFIRWRCDQHSLRFRHVI
jgi:hypothetical protein